MLALVWGAYDDLRNQVLSGIDCAQADEDLERSVTQLLVPRIQYRMSGLEPFCITHGPYEWATRQQPPAQPPQYDLAFILNVNPRVMWPLEAKVLRTDQAVANYVRDVQQQFLTGRYAPFTPSAAMLGYLLDGEPDAAFRAIEIRLGCKLAPHAAFTNRPHRTSEHTRQTTMLSETPRDFRCHHLVFALRVSRPGP